MKTTRYTVEPMNIEGQDLWVVLADGFQVAWEGTKEEANDRREEMEIER